MTIESTTLETTAVYIGRRITTKNQLAHFWIFHNENTSRGYRKQIAPASIGEQWIFKTNEAGTVLIAPTEKPTRTDVTSASKSIDEWTAADQASYQLDIVRRFESKLANRKDQFDQAIEPLRRMCSSRKLTHNERAAFIQRVTTELWRPLKE
jgi:hypothetical protein